MKILWIGGSHPRHLFCMNSIHQKFSISGAIIQKRESMNPSIPDGIEENDKKNFIRHFSNREIAERNYFGSPDFPECDRIETTGDSLNNISSLEFVKSIEPDVVIIFGSELIKEPLLASLPKHTINLHLGISPRYRGSATLFWPFYFMEPPYAGSTFHYIVTEPDAGNIIHQSIPNLEPIDGIHDVACKTVISSTNDLIRLLEIFEVKREWKSYKQRGTGKNFLDSDFKPEHLRVIYNLFNDDMVKQYLDGKLKSKVPKLIRQF